MMYMCISRNVQAIKSMDGFVLGSRFYVFIFYDYFTGAVVSSWLYQRQRCNPDEYVCRCMIHLELIF